MLYTEARLGSLIAIGKGDVPRGALVRMVRTLPAACDWQTQRAARARARRRCAATRFYGGWYEWDDAALRAVVGRQHVRGADADARARRGAARAARASARNDAAHVAVQRRFALEELG